MQSIKADTRLNRGIFVDYCNFFGFRQGIKPYILILTPLLMLALAVYSFSFGNITGGIVCAAAGLLVPAVYILFLSMTIRRQIKNVSFPAERTVYSCYFADDFSITMYDGKTEKFSWDSIFKVYDLPEYFYVYTTPIDSYIVNKNGITEGNAELLADLIRQAIPKNKFRRINKVLGIIR